MNVYVFNIGSICIHGKELVIKLSFHQKCRERTLWPDVRHIWKVYNRTIRWDLWSVSNQLGRFSMETSIFGQWWRSHQSLACKGLCTFRFCFMSWIGDSEPSIQYCLGRTVATQSFQHNWRRADGMRVEYFPRIHHIAAQPQSPRVTVRMSVTPEKFIGRIIFMSMFKDVIWRMKDNEKECNANAALVFLFTKGFPAGRWSFFGLLSETTWILLPLTDHKENGTESLNCWWSNSEKADTQFSEPLVHCLEERSKANEVENYRSTIVPIWKRLRLSHNYLCKSAQSLRSSRRNVWRIWILSCGKTRCDVLSFRSFFHISSNITLHRAQMSHVEKNISSHLIPLLKAPLPSDYLPSPCAHVRTLRCTGTFFAPLPLVPSGSVPRWSRALRSMSCAFGKLL